MTVNDYIYLINQQHDQIVKAITMVKALGKFALDDSELTVSDMDDIMRRIRLLEITDYTYNLVENIYNKEV